MPESLSTEMSLAIWSCLATAPFRGVVKMVQSGKCDHEAPPYVIHSQTGSFPNRHPVLRKHLDAFNCFPARSVKTRAKSHLLGHELNVMTIAGQPLMEITEANSTGSPAPTATARRSGRVTKAPEKFSPDAPAAAKRKRDQQIDGDDEEDAEDGPASAEEDSDNDAADESGDEDEQARLKRKAAQSRKAAHPAAKKPKINGDAHAGPNHAARLPSRPKKTVRIAVERREGDGLYGTRTPRLHFKKTPGRVFSY